MMCYRDRRFCQFDDCVSFCTCHMALTPDIKAAAERWWTSAGGKAEDTPIDYYADRPICFCDDKDKPQISLQ